MKITRIEKTKKVTLGEKIGIEEFIAVTRFNAEVVLSKEYVERVRKAREIIKKWSNNGVTMYGVNTGFGKLCEKKINKEDTSILQKNILLSHATSVGKPLEKEMVRAIMLMMLQNLGQGYSGVRIEILEILKKMLNKDIIPFTPMEGSVGYLCLEAHIALALIGVGKVYYKNNLIPAKDAFDKEDLKLIELVEKEGLALVSGTTSPTALGIVALYDIIKSVETADIIGALTHETLNGTVKAFDERLMNVRPHVEQQETAKKIRNLLKDSERSNINIEYRLQDALSLRCIPQLHGASKKTLLDALKTFEIEINSCCDNPIIWHDEEKEEVISGGNPDASYVGLEIESAGIAAVMVAKMSERRNNRLIDGNLSELPDFLVKESGLNSGLMIPQYTQAGLLNDMKRLSVPAIVDSIPTCANQEDYTSMGYNSSKKALEISEKLEYVLSIELLSVYQGQQFLQKNVKNSSISIEIYKELEQFLPTIKKDEYIYPLIEKIKAYIHDGNILKVMEKYEN